MKILAAALVGMLLVGCEYTVPLVTKPETKIDQALLGVWQRTTDDKQERLLVLPLDATEYLVSFPAGNNESLFARACLTQIGGEPLVQLRWFGTAQGVLPEDSRVYQYATYAVSGDTLTVQMLSSEVVPKETKTSEELLRAITEAMDQPDLFREAMVFQRVKQ